MIQAPSTLAPSSLTIKAPILLFCWLFVMHITGKNLFSDALHLTACWAQYFRFILVDIGEAGRHSDGGILSHSSFGQPIEAGMLSIPGASPFQVTNIPMWNTYLFTGTTVPSFQYVFVGDEAFPLRTNMLRPYPSRNLPS